MANMDQNERMAAALQRLDAGALADIFNGTPGRVTEPVVQCVSIKPMQNQGDVERHRVVFSDSKNYVLTMPSSAVNDEIHSGRLRRGVVVQLIGYQANNVKGKR